MKLLNIPNECTETNLILFTQLKELLEIKLQNKMMLLNIPNE